MFPLDSDKHDHLPVHKFAAVILSTYKLKHDTDFQFQVFKFTPTVSYSLLIS